MVSLILPVFIGIRESRDPEGVGAQLPDHHERLGTGDLGKKDCHDRVDRVEEGSVLRRPISETTSSLSVSDRVRSIPGNLLWWWPSGSRDTLVRGRVSAE